MLANLLINHEAGDQSQSAKLKQERRQFSGGKNLATKEYSFGVRGALIKKGFQNRGKKALKIGLFKIFQLRFKHKRINI